MRSDKSAYANGPQAEQIARSALVLSSAIALRRVYVRVLDPVRALVASNVAFLAFVKGTHDEYMESVDRASP